MARLWTCYGVQDNYQYPSTDNITDTMIKIADSGTQSEVWKTYDQIFSDVKALDHDYNFFFLGGASGMYSGQAGYAFVQPYKAIITQGITPRLASGKVIDGNNSGISNVEGVTRGTNYYYYYNGSLRRSGGTWNGGTAQGPDGYYYIYRSGSNYNGYTFPAVTSLFSEDIIIDGAAPIIYNWESWDYLRGNNGQFRANLTMIKDDSIPDDLFSYKEYELSDFLRLSNESSIWNAFLNSPVNEERTVVWNGRCRMTLTVSDPVGQPTTKLFTFKFYTPDATTEFYSFEQYIPISSTTPSNNYRDYYLTWLYDENNQLAIFYPIAYAPQSIAQYRHVAPSTTITESQMATMYLWLMARDAGSGDPSNPYDTGTEDTGGNPSGYDGHQDDIINVTPPSLDGTSSGMFTIYCPDETELTQIAAFLWSDNVIDNFKKYFNNFSDNIIAFYVLPYKPQNMPTKAFKVGRVTSDTITSVEYVTNRFVTIDMGELVIDDKWDSYLDFGPYTKFNIYLPGIGVQALDADDIMCPANQDGSMPSQLGSTIKLEYNMDLMTGILVCFVKINGQVRYQFSGKIGYQIPLTGETHRTLMQGFAMATAGLIGTVATGGAAAPFAAAAASAAIINAMKPDVYRGGNLSGDAASLCYKTPYLIRRMPNKPMLVDQQKFTGYQSYKTGLLSEFSGYTEVVDAHVEGISCTEEERELIMDWLRKGVIL